MYYEFAKNRISSPQHLHQCLNIIFEPDTLKTTDCIYRCYCWMAFSGIEECDAMNVKCSDVDFLHMRIHVKDQWHIMYDESFPAFRNAALLNQFQYIHGNYGSPVWRNRCNGDELLRGIRGIPSVKSARIELSRRNKKAYESGKSDIQLSYGRIKMSGQFYRMYQREQTGENPDFQNEDILFEYNMWKASFY